MIPSGIGSRRYTHGSVRSIRRDPNRAGASSRDAKLIARDLVKVQCHFHTARRRVTHLQCRYLPLLPPNRRAIVSITYSMLAPAFGGRIAIPERRCDGRRRSPPRHSRAHPTQRDGGRARWLTAL